jgi:hypothetical protein
MRIFALVLFGLALAAEDGRAQMQKFAVQYAFESPDVPAAVRREAPGEPWTAAEAGPVPGLKLFAREKSGAVWLGSGQGAARFDPAARHRWDRWQYFQGRRWLRDDDVRNIVVEETSAGRKAAARRVWLRTATGISLIEWRPMTLEQKAGYFEERIEQRHVRHGMVADSHLRAAGDPASNQKVSSDNDGLWTAIYLGAEAYRFAVTRDPEARRKARRSLDLLMRLQEITGIPGFPARSFIAADEPRPQDGEWHATADGQWWWKGDTSSDELVGHYYAYALYFDLVADAPEKGAIGQAVSRLTDHLIDHHYELIDLDGKPTRWGLWSEEYFQTEEGKYESALCSLELLSFLKTAGHITGQRKYRDAYDNRVKRGYAERMRYYRRWLGGGEINFSDDELAYLAYQPLLQYESEPELRRLYLDGLRFTWSQVRPDMNPLWNYISAAGGAGRMTREIREESRRTLERIPMDMIEWDARNSQRRDVKFRPEKDRHGRPHLVEVLPPDERPVSKWNGNPYHADGGSGGHAEDDGAYFLLPYWMGRYYHWVK